MCTHNTHSHTYNTHTHTHTDTHTQTHTGARSLDDCVIQLVRRDQRPLGLDQPPAQWTGDRHSTASSPVAAGYEELASILTTKPWSVITSHIATKKLTSVCAAVCCRERQDQLHTFNVTTSNWRHSSGSTTESLTACFTYSISTNPPCFIYSILRFHPPSWLLVNKSPLLSHCVPLK